MDEFNFEQLINFEVPDSWEEKAINIPLKNYNDSPVKFSRLAAGIAACLVIAVAVMLSTLSGINKNVDLIAPDPDPSQADVISGGTAPTETDGAQAPSETPPVYTAGNDQSTTVFTEPAEDSVDGGENGADPKQQATYPTNISSKSQNREKPSTGKADQNLSSTETKAEAETINGTESGTESAVKPTEPESERLLPVSNEPQVEDNTVDPDPIYKSCYSFEAKSESPLITKNIYCRIVNENGITLGDGDLFSPDRAAFKYGKTVKTLGFMCYCNFKYGKPYTVIFYNSDGDTIIQGTVVIGDSYFYEIN